MIITFLIIIVLMFTISIGILIYSKDEYDSLSDDNKKIDYDKNIDDEIIWGV